MHSMPMTAHVLAPTERRPRGGGCVVDGLLAVAAGMMMMMQQRLIRVMELPI